MCYKCNEGHSTSLPNWNFILNFMKSDSLLSNSKFKCSHLLYRCSHTTFLKKKKKGMQFTKLFKVKFSMVLVKGVRLASVKLSPLFSLRIVNYMYLTHAATTTTTLITTTTTTTKATRRERCAQIQEKLLKTNSTVTCPQPTRHSIKLSKI